MRLGSPKLVVSAILCAFLTATGASCGTSKPVSGSPAGPTPPSPLVAPKTSSTQDTQYLADVAKADPTLATYVQQQGDVALRALLVDGTAFCAFLHRGGGIDNALVSVAVGAKSLEPETSLPLSVSTFNTMEAVALLILCPSDQRLVPVSVRSKLHKLGSALASPSS